MCTTSQPRHLGRHVPVLLVALALSAAACRPAPARPVLPPPATTTTSTTAPSTTSTTTTSTTSTTTTTSSTTTTAPSTTTTTPPATPVPGPTCAAADTSAPLEPMAVDEAVDAAREALAARPGDLAVTVVDQGRPHTEVEHYTDTATATREVADLAADGTVVAVESDRRATLADEAAAVSPTAVSPDPREVDQWALSALDAGTAWATTTGAGTTVAVVDTGVQPDHPDLAGRVLDGRSFLSQGVESPGAPDANGHGTHVAGIVAAGRNDTGIVGLAHGSSVLPVRALDASGSGWMSDVANAVVWATDQGADVVNLSLGASSSSSSLLAAVRWAADHDVVVVAAAGNTGACGTARWPAAYDEVVAVAATTSAGSVADYSTTGTYVDVAAPGSNVLSTVPGSTWGYKSGTSMASPYVAATVALVRAAHPTWSATQVRQRLETTTVDIVSPGRDQWSGWGRIDPARAVAP